LILAFNLEAFAVLRAVSRKIPWPVTGTFVPVATSTFDRSIQ